MKYLIAIMLAFSVSAHAANTTKPNVWDLLKQQPATKHDIGKIYLAMASLAFKDKMVGKQVGDTHYAVSNFDTEELNGRLGLKLAYTARGKYINPAECDAFLNSFSQKMNTRKLVGQIWPYQSAETLDELAKDFIYSLDLVNKDNGAVMTTCHN